MNRQAISSLPLKLAVVVVAGSVYLLAYFYFWSSPTDAVVSPPAVNKPPATAASPQPAVAGQGPGEGRERLNPFDVPAVFLASQQADQASAATQAPNAAAGPGVYGGGRMLDRPLRLTGITVTGVARGDDGVSLAVLNSGGNQARAYRPGETVNGYRIVAITGNAVVFNGPAGREILPVATQVNKAAKSNAEERTGMKDDTMQTVAH